MTDKNTGDSIATIATRVKTRISFLKRRGKLMNSSEVSVVQDGVTDLELTAGELLSLCQSLISQGDGPE